MCAKIAPASIRGVGIGGTLGSMRLVQRAAMLSCAPLDCGRQRRWRRDVRVQRPVRRSAARTAGRRTGRPILRRRPCRHRASKSTHVRHEAERSADGDGDATHCWCCGRKIALALRYTNKLDGTSHEITTLWFLISHYSPEGVVNYVSLVTSCNLFLYPCVLYEYTQWYSNYGARDICDTLTK